MHRAGTPRMWLGERQVDGRLEEDQCLARCGVGPGHVKQGCQRHHHLRQVGFFLLGACGGADGCATGVGRKSVRIMETHMSDRTLCRKVYDETECFQEGGGNLSDFGPSSYATN